MDRPTPDVLTFDIFGTVVDWQAGLVEAAGLRGFEVDERLFEAVIAEQARLEAGPFRPYAEILAESLVGVLGMDAQAARDLAAEAGSWPLFADSADGLRRLMRVSRCVAMTNSDRMHGRRAQERLGFQLSGWISAEDVRCYKPDAAFWAAARTRLGVEFGPSWWHVSAYADYDMETAARLGLTTVFVERPHSRWGRSRVAVKDLRTLAARLGV